MEYEIIRISDNLALYLDQIIEIEKASFPSPWSPGAFEAEINNKVSNLWAVVSNKDLAGYVCFWMFDTEIHILNLAVHPGKRCGGIGETLLGSTINKGIAEGVSSVWLEVRPSNLSAMALYNKLGFIEVGRRPHYYSETNEDAIIMSLDLTQKMKGNIAFQNK